MYVDVLEFRVEEMSMGLTHLLAGLARSSADALFAMTHPAIVLDIQPQCAAAKKPQAYAKVMKREICRDQFEGDKFKIRRART